MDLFTKTGAAFSDCRRYRYTLWRSWGVGDYCNFVMLNPSTADEVKNDPTVERCERRSREMGFGGLMVTNLFAFRATDPFNMKKAADPIGERNDDAIKECASQSAMVICAWGNDGAFMDRSAAVVKMLREFCPDKLHALKITGQGEPYHPLYVGYKTRPTKW